VFTKRWNNSSRRETRSNVAVITKKCWPDTRVFPESSKSWRKNFCHVSNLRIKSRSITQENWSTTPATCTLRMYRSGIKLLRVKARTPQWLLSIFDFNNFRLYNLNKISLPPSWIIDRGLKRWQRFNIITESQLFIFLVNITIALASLHKFGTDCSYRAFFLINLRLQMYIWRILGQLIFER